MADIRGSDRLPNGGPYSFEASYFYAPDIALRSPLPRSESPDRAAPRSEVSQPACTHSQLAPVSCRGKLIKQKPSPFLIGHGRTLLVMVGFCSLRVLLAYHCLPAAVGCGHENATLQPVNKSPCILSRQTFRREDSPPSARPRKHSGSVSSSKHPEER